MATNEFQAGFLGSNAQTQTEATGGGMSDPSSPFASMVGLSGFMPGITNHAKTDNGMPCGCPDCQVMRLSLESPDNTHLLKQWGAFKLFLLEKDLITSSARGSFLVSDSDKIGKVADEFGLDPRLREIVVSEFTKLEIQEGLAKDTHDPPEVIVLIMPTEDYDVETILKDPVLLDRFLKLCYEEGILEIAGVPYQGEIYYIEEIITQKSSELPVEIIEILQKYVNLFNFD